MENDTSLWRISQVCEYLNCSPPSVRDLVRQGKLKAYRVGGDEPRRMLRYKPEEVKALLKPIKGGES